MEDTVDGANDSLDLLSDLGQTSLGGCGSVGVKSMVDSTNDSLKLGSDVGKLGSFGGGGRMESTVDSANDSL